MLKMYAVISRDKYGENPILVSVHLTEYDARTITKNQSEYQQYEVREFDLDWGHWIEYRKTLGIY